jgi:hypothetical protein
MNNAILYNAVLNGLLGGASRTCLAVISSTFTDIDAVAVAIATAIDAEIPTIVGGATTSQAELLTGIVNGAFRGQWPSDSTADFSTVVDNIATQFVAQNALLVPIAGPGDITAQPNDYWVNNNSTGTSPDGSIANPYHTLQAALDAIVTAATDEPSLIHLAASDTAYTGVNLLVTRPVSIIAPPPVSAPHSGLYYSAHITTLTVGGYLGASGCSFTTSVTATSGRFCDCDIECPVQTPVITATAAYFTFISCRFGGGATITGNAGSTPSSVVFLDGFSYYYYLVTTPTLTNITPTILDSPSRQVNEYWVNNNSTAIRPDGSMAHPYTTLQAAVSAADSAATGEPSVIHVAPSDTTYDDVTSTMSGQKVIIVGGGDWTNTTLGSFSLSFSALEVRNCKITGTWDVSSFASNACNIACTAIASAGDIQLLCSIMQAGVALVSTAVGGASLNVDGMSNYFVVSEAPTLSGLTKVLWDVSSGGGTITRQPGEYWVNNNTTVTPETGSIAAPYSTLQLALDAVVTNADTQAVINLAPSATAYSGTNTSVTVPLTIQGPVSRYPMCSISTLRTRWMITVTGCICDTGGTIRTNNGTFVQCLMLGTVQYDLSGSENPTTLTLQLCDMTSDASFIGTPEMTDFLTCDTWSWCKLQNLIDAGTPPTITHLTPDQMYHA